jgi:hypothetical protein
MIGVQEDMNGFAIASQCVFNRYFSVDEVRFAIHIYLLVIVNSGFTFPLICKYFLHFMHECHINFSLSFRLEKRL